MKRYVLAVLGLLLFHTPAMSQDNSIKIDPEKDYVYYLDAAYEKETEGDWAKETEGSFYLPFINVDNEDIQVVNQNLEKIYTTFYPFARNQADSEYSYVLEAKKFLNQDTLTILIKYYRYDSYYGHGRTEFTLVPINIDLHENRVMAPEEVLNLSGYTLSEVIEYVESRMRLLGYEIYHKGDSENYEPETYFWVKSEYVSSFTVKPYRLNILGIAVMQVFLDDNQNLNVLVPITKINNSLRTVYYESLILPFKEDLK